MPDHPFVRLVEVVDALRSTYPGHPLAAADQLVASPEIC